VPPVQVVSAVVHLAVELLVVVVRLVAEEQLVEACTRAGR
jgi:hypothetical protein